MAVNAEVSKTGSENALATIRKFSRRVQGTGLIKNARNTRYFARDTSKIVKKKRALKLIKRRAEYKQLVKEGKVTEAPARYGQRSGSGSMSAANRESGNTSPRLGEGTPIAR